MTHTYGCHPEVVYPVRGRASNGAGEGSALRRILLDKIKNLVKLKLTRFFSFYLLTDT